MKMMFHIRYIGRKEVKDTTSNIGVSLISLHDTPRLHTLKLVIRIFFIRRTYNETSKRDSLAYKFYFLGAISP